MENNIELQEMREQLVSFKQQLANQQIINEQLMRRATAVKASKLKNKMNGVIGLGIFAVIFAPVSFFTLGFPMYFVLYTAAMIVFCTIMTSVYHRNINKTDFMNGDLKSFVVELKTLSRKYTQWYWFAIPLIIIFGILFYFSSLQIGVEQDMLNGLFIGAAVGGAVGMFVGIRINRSIVNLCNEIIKDIEEN